MFVEDLAAGLANWQLVRREERIEVHIINSGKSGAQPRQSPVLILCFGEVCGGRIEGLPTGIQ